MAILLYVLGAICLLGGSALVGMGFPDREFSFGNTLISAGTTTAMGGLILIGLGAVVGQLRKIANLDSARVSAPPAMPEIFEAPAPARPASGRIPFPPKPKAETGRDNRPAAIAPLPAAPEEEPPAAFAAPTLPNPDEPPAVTPAVTDEAPLSPPQSAALDLDTLDRSEEVSEKAAEIPAAKLDWLTPPRSTPTPARDRFAAMWPSESKAEKELPAAEEPVDADEPPPAEAALETEAPAAVPVPVEVAAEVRNVAILKSGVVDGMGYTLYVDGSIEAELPQGTLRFASIDELRRHLEENA